MIALLVGIGCATLSPQRDAVALYVWTERGLATAELARLYCLAASQRERRWMRDAIEAHGSARVVITCADADR
jgi:hypothetical protein